MSAAFSSGDDLLSTYGDLLIKWACGLGKSTDLAANQSDQIASLLNHWRFDIARVFFPEKYACLITRSSHLKCL